MTISGTSRLHERHSSSADVSPRSTRSGRARSASSSASPHAAAPRTSKPSSARCRSRKPRVVGSGSATRTAFGIVRRRYPRGRSRARCPLPRLCAEAETTSAPATPTPFSALPYAADVPPARATIAATAAAAAAALAALPAGSAPRRWQQAAPMPDHRGEVAAARVGGEIAVVGGFDRLRAKLRNAWVLSPGGSWRALPPLPAPRAAGGAAVVRGRLYVAGGVGPVGLARQTFVFDLRRCRWSSLPGPTPREHLAVTAARGRLYALAGRKAGFDANTTIFESLAPPARRWRGLPPVPAARGGTGAAVVDTTIVSVGGEAPQGTIATVYGFDLARRRWRRLPDLPTPRHGLGVVAAAGRVYAIAGGTTPGLATSGTNEFLPLR